MKHGTNKIIAGAGAAVRRLNPHLFGPPVASAGAAALRSAEPKRDSRRALVSPVSRKVAGTRGGAGRYRVRFTIYAMRPRDWDNNWTKPLQDCLVAAGLLPGDDWRTLEGSCVSRKAATKAQERTVIEIWKIG